MSTTIDMSIAIFESICNYNVSKHTQNDVVDFITSMIKHVPESQQYTILDDVLYAMMVYNLHAIPDGTYSYILSKNEVNTYIKSKQGNCNYNEYMIEEIPGKQTDIKSITFPIDPYMYKGKDDSMGMLYNIAIVIIIIIEFIVFL